MIDVTEHPLPRAYDRLVLAQQIVHDVCIEADDRYESHAALDLVVILLESVADDVRTLRGLPT